MTSDEIISIIQEIFRDVLDDESVEIKRETTAEDVEDWDSLSHINLVVAIENQFDIKIALGELQLLKNVGDMVDLIGRKTE